MAYFEGEFPPADVADDEDEAKEAEIDVAWDAYVAFLPGWVRARKLTAWRRNLRALLAQQAAPNQDPFWTVGPSGAMTRADQRK